jgi:membrane fusion protein (multidrug efflux system)
VLRVDTSIATESEVHLVARSTGQLLRVLVERGEPVRKGQSLAEFDSHEERLALNAAEAELTLMKSVVVRRRVLREDGLVSEEQLQEAEFDVALAQARVELASYRVDQTTVRAPFDGVILDCMANEGMYLQESHAVPLFRLSGEGPLEARVYLPQWVPAYLDAAAPVQVYPLLHDHPLPGDLHWLSPVVDPVAGTVEARVRLKPGAAVRRGSSVRLEFTLVSDPEHPSIPLSGLLEAQLESGAVATVLVATHDGFQRREVWLGLVGEERAEVRKGLVAGDRIVDGGPE